MRSVRTTPYKKRLALLPVPIQNLAQLLYLKFREDPWDPGLRAHPLADSKKGRHRPGSISVEITRRYRAIYNIDNGPDGHDEPQYCWYWIGTHEEYNNFIGSK